MLESKEYIKAKKKIIVLCIIILGKQIPEKTVRDIVNSPKGTLSYIYRRETVTWYRK